MKLFRFGRVYIGEMENQEHQDPVWDLLDNASKTDVSPFFARNVVREVRQLKQTDSGVLEGFFNLFRRPTVALCGTAAIAVFVLAFFLNTQPSGEDSRGGTESSLAVGSAIDLDANASLAFDPAAEIETIEYLGQLMVVADPGQLSDDALADLFF